MARKLEIPAGEFKARCLALLDRVAETGEEVVVTKRGRPVARVVPVETPAPLEGSIIREGDLISPIDEPWSEGE
ncbi:MAG: type II toxin-antitoxin system Phd/YefM family antitoxin [Thermoanaerobaculia bacterium]